MNFQSTDCILVMGRRGCGKSFLAKRLQSMWPRRIIIDSLNEYGTETGAVLVHSFFDFSENLVRLKESNAESFELVFQFDPESHISEVEFDQIVRCAYYFGNVQLIIEEIQLYSNPHTIPNWLKNALLTGRHQNLSLMFTSQRPGEVNKTIISQCSHVFVGSIHEGNDLRYLANFLNQETSKLVSLPDRQFLYFSKDGIVQISNDF